MKKLLSAQDLEAYRQECVAAREPQRTMITVCTGTGCQAHGCNDVVAAFREELARQGLENVTLKATG